MNHYDRFAEIPISSKKTGSYRDYLFCLKDYLVDFLARTRPILDVEDELSRIDEEFYKKWDEGNSIIAKVIFYRY